MALIKCPNCKKEISDKAKKCVHCGADIIKEQKTLCPECGNEIEEGEKSCSKCGCPIKHKKTKKEIIKDRILIVLIVIALFVTAAIYSYYKANIDELAGYSSQSKRSKYEEKLATAADSMLEGARSAESCGTMIHDVWYNTIFEERNEETDKFTMVDGVFRDDFNDSLTALFADEDFSAQLDDIRANKKEVSKLMKDAKNPPNKYKDAYEELEELYDNYLTLTGLCLSPTGNITSYTSSFNDADTATAKSIEKMHTYLD